MQQRKKRLIILCSILSVVLVIVVLASTLFNLKSVRVEFKNLRCVLNENTISSASIVDAGKFDFGSNILFKDVDEYANNIEKTFGYAQVLKIERIFPSSYTVHIAEREPCVLVKKGEEFVVLDRFCKVLKVSNFENLIAENFENACPILNIDGLDASTLEMGDFVENETLKNTLIAVRMGLWSVTRFTNVLSDITLSLTENSELLVEMTCKSASGGGKIVVQGANDLDNKMLRAFGVLDKILVGSNPVFEYINVSSGGNVTSFPEFVK